MPIRLAGALTLALAATGVAADPAARFMGAFPWERSQSYFGGVSGFDLFDNGRRFGAVGDNGQTMIGEITRADGVITRIDSPWIGGLREADGERVTGERRDSEGLAIAPDGRWFVSFERDHRVAVFTDREANGTVLPAHPDFEALPYNASLEGLAIAPDGALVAVSEGQMDRAGGYPVFRFDGKAWTLSGALPTDGGWRPVGLDIDARGRVYLLERRWALPIRFASRVRRFTDAFPDGPSELLLETDPGTHDNLEGIAVWRDGADIVITMVSDDNHKFFQRTEIVEYRLADPLDPSTPLR